MLIDTLIAFALLLGFFAFIWGLALAITTDKAAGNFPGRMED